MSVIMSDQDSTYLAGSVYTSMIIQPNLLIYEYQLIYDALQVSSYLPHDAVIILIFFISNHSAPFSYRYAH